MYKTILKILRKIKVFLIIVLSYFLTIQFWTTYFLNLVFLHSLSLTFYLFEYPENKYITDHFDSFRWAFKTIFAGGANFTAVTLPGKIIELLALSMGLLAVAIFTGIFTQYLMDNKQFQKEFRRMNNVE